MSKETFYFSHDYNTRSDMKIQKLIARKGYLGYGIFWAIIEDLYNNNNQLEYDLEVLSFNYRIDEDFIKSIITDFDLFINDGKYICSKSVKNRLDERQKKSVKGKENALKRWGNEDSRINSDKGIFYVLRVFNDNEEFIKCGLTTESISRRYSGKLANYKYDVLYQNDIGVINTLEIEKQISDNFNKYLPLDKFGGYLECYDISEKDNILNFAMQRECKTNAIKESKVKESKIKENKEVIIEETKVSKDQNSYSLNSEKEKKETKAQKTIREKKEFIEALEMNGAFEDYAEEYVNYRLNKKLSVSKIVLNKFLKESNGLNLNEVIEICMSKGWQSFERGWYDNLKNNKQNNYNNGTESKPVEKIGRIPVEEFNNAGSTIDFDKFNNY